LRCGSSLSIDTSRGKSPAVSRGYGVWSRIRSEEVEEGWDGESSGCKKTRKGKR
jgi:hypothetical protein